MSIAVRSLLIAFAVCQTTVSAEEPRHKVIVVFTTPPTMRIESLSKEGEGHWVHAVRYPYIGSPTFSPDGEWIAFDAYAADEGPPECWVIHRGGNQLRRIAVGATPRFSPDGKRLLFMRETRFHEKEKAGVFVIGFDGEGERRLCEGRWPDWSPDGKQIAFSKGGEFEKGGTVVGARVYVASADGKNPRELCAGDGPAWSPDGNRKPHQVVETSHATREHSCHCPIWAFRRHLVLWPSPRRSCGMVPPIYVTDNTSIVRVGDEQTYVFYKDGLETFVIRPGFSGKVEDFGMLISFPTPPALRKVSEDIFPQIAKAIDPPEVVVDLRPRPGVTVFFSRSEVRQSKRDFDGLALGKDEVRVLKQEAVGMYEVAVLEAGSAKALKRWMDDHGYKYPSGMDAACEEYVKLAGALWPRRPRSAARPTSIPSRG